MAKHFIKLLYKKIMKYSSLITAEEITLIWDVYYFGSVDPTQGYICDGSKVDDIYVAEK